MQTEFDEEIREFLIESNENLAALDQQIVELEKDPENYSLISSIFRTIHSIKGTCSFFGFDILGSVTHLVESILVQLREKQRPLTPELISLFLEAIDAVKLLLTRIETSGAEGADESEDLRTRLEECYRFASGGDTLKMLMKIAEGERTVTAPVVTEPVVCALPQAKAPEAAPPASTIPPSLLPSLAPAVADVVVATAETTKSTSPTEGPAELCITDSTIRVDVNLLNQLMNLVGELVLTRNQLLQAAGAFSPAAQQTSQRLNIITTELQEGVMKTRMQPIGVIWNKLPRVVRDLSSKCGKQIQIEMLGAETELDKSLIEAIRDPLTHIVRNSCDHGIEQPAERQRKGKPPVGILSLRAFHEAGAVNIEISDDGAGINADKVLAKALEKKLVTPERAATMSKMEAVNLIFLPGFSTAEQVTSLSGRGVGMDVVKTNIEKISGSVEVVLLPEGGTAIKIKIPLTLAIIPGLIVASQQHSGQHQGREDRFVIPQSHLVELTRVDMTTNSHLIETVHGATIIRHRDKLLPLIYLSKLLKRATTNYNDGQINIIILQVSGRQFGLVVDRICDTQEIVVKPLGQQLKSLACYGGATIMGDGQPALILDVGGIAKLAGLEAKTQQLAVAATKAKSAEVVSELLLFSAGIHHRLGLPLAIVNRLEEIPVENLELASGQHVVSYRGELLSLFHVASFLEGNRSTPALPESGRVKVVVINNGDRRLGLIVDEIIDIVEGTIDIMRSSTDPSIMGSAVIAGTVTDLLDVTVINNKATENWSRSAKTNAYRWRILFYDPSPLSREMMHTLLNAAGYLYCSVSSAEEAGRILNEGGVHLMIASDSAGGIPAWWQDLASQDGRFSNCPQILLTDTDGTVRTADKVGGRQVVSVARHDRAELLRTIAQLTMPAVGKCAA